MNASQGNFFQNSQILPPYGPNGLPQYDRVLKGKQPAPVRVAAAGSRLHLLMALTLVALSVPVGCVLAAWRG